MDLRSGVDPQTEHSPSDEDYGEAEQLKDLEEVFGIRLPERSEQMSREAYLSICRRDNQEEQRLRLEVANNTNIPPGPLNKRIPIGGKRKQYEEETEALKNNGTLAFRALSCTFGCPSFSLSY